VSRKTFGGGIAKGLTLLKKTSQGGNPTESWSPRGGNPKAKQTATGKGKICGGVVGHKLKLF